MRVENGVLLKVTDEDIIDDKFEFPEGVTSIGNRAFENCTSLTEIRIPEGVTSIGNGAFYNCSSLTEIRIPEGVTSIGANAFSFCASLTEVHIPEGVTSIGANAFSHCRSLTEIHIPKEVTSIGREAFYECINLIKIHIPEGVTSIEKSVFLNCRSLTEVDIPKGVMRIGDRAFDGCTCLTEIYIPKGVTSIENYAFSRCGSLTNVHIPEGVTSIGDCAFCDCRSLTEVYIPKGVIIIGLCTFSGCSSLTEVHIPEGVTSIGEYAFGDCGSLTEIHIPEGAINIENNAFSSCISLTKIKYGNRDIELQDNILEIKTNKYGILCIGKDKISVGLKNQNELIKDGYINENISQEKRDEQEQALKSQLEQIYNNKNFKISTNFKQEHAIDYLNKIINVLGANEAENLLKIPNGVTEQDIQECGEKLLQVYEPKYKLEGNIPLVISMFENIDTVISKESKDVKNDRNKFYTKFNELLENGDRNLIIEDLLKICAKEIGLELSNSQIEKIKRELQTTQITEKSDEIRDKIKQKLDNPDANIIQVGVSSSLIYNVIKQNILNGGRKEEIEEILNKEIERTRSDGTRYYGANIINQKEKLKQTIYELYKENEELLKCNMVDILRDTKDKTGNRWIARIKNAKSNIRDLQNMTEEERNKVVANLEKNEINMNLSFAKRYKLNLKISPEEAIEILGEEDFPELLTYEKAETMFSGMKEPVSEKFGEWFVENKAEIMKNSEYYTNLSTLHNEFKYIIQDPIVNATFENKALSPKLAFNILNSIEKEGRPGNEELSRIASNVVMSKDDFETAQDIFETTKKREKSYIPSTQVTKKHYRGRILRADDPMNILAGNATDCCQKIGDVGSGTMEHASTENNGRIFIVEEINERGEAIKPVAQSWVWRNKDRVCFDNIEIPDIEKPKLGKDGDKKAQEEILEIYKQGAKNLIKQDEKMLQKLLEGGKITKEMYEQLVLKDVTVGTGYNDLGILKNSGLDIVPEEEMILPKEKDKLYNGRKPWVDSGRDSDTGVGAQLYLANGEEKREKTQTKKTYDLEDLPVKPMYHNEREVRHLKARTIDKGVVSQIKEIEDNVYRGEQKLLSKCADYKDIAEVYDIDKNDIQVYISREKDWYMIFKEDEKELYIADLAMVNGINAQGKGTVKTEVVQQTLEMEKDIYNLMLQAAREQKQVRCEATEDTSYINMSKMAKKGLVHIQEDEKSQWGNSEINMHNMVVTVDIEKMEEELKRVEERLEKRREERLMNKVEDKEER